MRPFRLLGVDTILQKTQEDLGRIKKTSYFQRKKAETPTPSEESKSIVTPTTGDQSSKAPRWIGFEEGSHRQEDCEEQSGAESASAAAHQQEEAEPKVEEQNFPEEEEEEDPAEEDEDIFNTEYVDVVTSGELKLAYVPDDSPTDDGDDPFDTSVVEKVVGPLPVIKKKRALVSIGSAAQVLSAANAAGAPVSHIRRREIQPPTEIQLLGCLDDDDQPPSRPRSPVRRPLPPRAPGIANRRTRSPESACPSA